MRHDDDKKRVYVSFRTQIIPYLKDATSSVCSWIRLMFDFLLCLHFADCLLIIVWNFFHGHVLAPYSQ